METVPLRSPSETLGGLVHLPRMLDKIRAQAAGTLPEAYQKFLGRGFDGRVCAFLQLDYAALAEVVSTRALDDAAALRWCEEEGSWPEVDARLIFNDFMRKRGWRDELTPRLHEMVEEMGLDDDGSIDTAFAALDADEGRPPAAGPSVDGSPILAERMAIFQAHAQPFTPVPTGEAPRLSRFPDIRAVVFDIYGTLFMSGTGDISLAEAEDRSAAMRATLEQAGIQGIPEKPPLADRFHALIKEAQAARKAEGTDYPEVEIREIWRTYLQRLAEAGARVPMITNRWLARLAIDYECRVNPVWPMPGLAPTLAALKLRGMRLGIVSNAQFYTKIMFPAFLGTNLTELGFSLDCCIYSYRERRGKPSILLYEQLREALKRYGIAPAETLYIGNDMRNDVAPAAAIGFKTVLFAGDQRSLRWRRDGPAPITTEPDAIVTELWQILHLI